MSVGLILQENKTRRYKKEPPTRPSWKKKNRDVKQALVN